MNKFLPVSEPSITHREINYVLNAVKSTWVSSLGKYITEFEKRFAQYIDTKYALTTANGTTALHLALVTLGIKRGDEVIIPDFTFIATANAVHYTGAKPVFVDIDPETWCISPESIKKAITSKTKAIIPVHVYGHPADMDPISRIAKEYGLYIIEDAAEAHGAEYKGKKVGSIGILGAYSFYGNKIITTGEGGMLTTNNKKLYQKAQFLKDHAMYIRKRYWHPQIGFNYRITNIQAALGLAQLERIDWIINKKISIYKWYNKYLNNIDGLGINVQKEWAKNVYWMICLILKKNFGITRNQLMKKLRDKGIDSRPFFYPMSQMPMYRTKLVNPIAYDISKRGINLPSGVNLNKEDVKRICNTVKTILRIK